MKPNLVRPERPIINLDQELYSISEAASRLRLSKFTVRLFIARGELPIVRLGRRVLIHRDDLKKFVEDRREKRGDTKNPRLSGLA